MYACLFVLVFLLRGDNAGISRDLKGSIIPPCALQIALERVAYGTRRWNIQDIAEGVRRGRTCASRQDQVATGSLNVLIPLFYPLHAQLNRTLFHYHGFATSVLSACVY